MNDTIRSYYATQSEMSDPRRLAHLYDDLGEKLDNLVEAIGNVLILREDARELGLGASGGRLGELSCRSISERLERIVTTDPSPLSVRREPKDRQISRYRDFALLFVSMLRHRGIPARLRVAFAQYGTGRPPIVELVRVAELWDERRKGWRTVDPRLAVRISGGSGVEAAALRPDVDPLDLVAGKQLESVAAVWQMVRARRLSVEQLLYDGQSVGMRGLRSSLLHDLQALNKVELMSTDNWDELGSKRESAITVADRKALDRIAALIVDPDRTFDEMRRCFEENPGTRAVMTRLQFIGEPPTEGHALPDVRPDSEMDRLRSRLGEALMSHARTPKEAAPDDDDAWNATEGVGNDLVVRGARQNNLKGIDVRIPRDRVTVVTGVSGSGKSSLVFDTIYAESQRRFMETLSPFARQFAKQMEKPDVDRVVGLIPAVALEQQPASANSLSTVGSITSVIDLLRTLFARIGRMHCPTCGRPVVVHSAQQVANSLMACSQDAEIEILATSGSLESARRDRWADAVIAEGFTIGAGAEDAAPIEALIERLPGRAAPSDEPSRRSMLREAIETTYRLSDGVAVVRVGGHEYRFVRHHTCPYCHVRLQSPSPRMLNPRTVYGMCDACTGSGVAIEVDVDRLVPDPTATLLEGALAFYGPLTSKKNDLRRERFAALANRFDADLKTPWENLPEALRRLLLHGSGSESLRLQYAARDGSVQVDSEERIDGAIHVVRRLYRQTKSEASRRKYMQYMRQQPCPSCGGERLAPEGRMMVLAGTRFPEIVSLSIDDLGAWIDRVKRDVHPHQERVAGDLVVEIEKRLAVLREVGLHYLSLDRAAPTLSGGEIQRVRLASQIGSELVGVLYVLDEPSIGLHAKDREPLLALLQHLRDIGNTILVVEHDRQTMRAADWIVDIGPGAGRQGGELVVQGTVEEVELHPDSLTGMYLSGARHVASAGRATIREARGWLTLRGARLHNLRNLDVRIPLGVLTCVTGVSGSGKSSLFTQTLIPALKAELGQGDGPVGSYNSIEGAEGIRSAFHLTQAPIGRNPRSNPATYVGLFDEIRALFAATPAAAERGLSAGAFSFNVKGGRCETCEGLGALKVDMQLLPDLWIRCSDCNGQRYSREVLEVRWRDHTIAEILEMDVRQAAAVFEDHESIARHLAVLQDAGLGYLRLGQSATTLSGGEAQRIKLARELGRGRSEGALYVLDEPTAGLHFADVERLIEILHRLVDEGSTVIVLEHDLDVIATANWVIDLGPGGGREGGRIVAQGSVRDVAATAASATGRELQQVLTASSS